MDSGERHNFVEKEQFYEPTENDISRNMRKTIFASILMTFVLLGCTNRDRNNFHLQGSVSAGVEDVKYLLYLIRDYRNIDMEHPTDTLEVVDGKFSFSARIDEPAGGMLQGVHQDGSKDFQFKEFWAIPGDTCVIRITGCKRYDEMEISGGRFYEQYNAFKAYRDSIFRPLLEKGNELQLASSQQPCDDKLVERLMNELDSLDKTYIKGIREYNRLHGSEEGCAIYQLQWLINNKYDFNLLDSTIVNGRFHKYVEYRRSQYVRK